MERRLSRDPTAHEPGRAKIPDPASSERSPSSPPIARSDAVRCVDVVFAERVSASTCDFGQDGGCDSGVPAATAGAARFTLQLLSALLRRRSPSTSASGWKRRSVPELLRGAVKSVEITYKGQIAQLNTKPMSAAALAGLLKSAMPDANIVSAPALAKDRGINVTESYIGSAERAESLIRITLETKDRKFAIVGTIYRGEPRIVRIFGVPMDAPFSENMLYIRNEDTPGFVGQLGHLLGAEKINIASFSLGRIEARGDAICLVSIDEKPSDQLCTQIAQINQVKIVDFVSF